MKICPRKTAELVKQLPTPQNLSWIEGGMAVKLACVCDNGVELPASGFNTRDLDGLEAQAVAIQCLLDLTHRIGQTTLQDETL